MVFQPVGHVRFFDGSWIGIIRIKNVLQDESWNRKCRQLLCYKRRNTFSSCVRTYCDMGNIHV